MVQVHSISLLVLLASVAHTKYVPQPKPICKNIKFALTTTAENFDLPPYPDSTAPTTFGQYMSSFNASTIPQNHTVSGTFNIAATFCEPANKVAERDGTIQLLLHGVGSGKEYWSGIGYPNSTYEGQYSWVHRATSQGYSTLAIDNLGNGESDHPDPISVVQLPLQLELVRTLISSLRSGSPCLDKKFNKVIFVAHSYGSLVARQMATQYPDTKDGADAYILTATSTTLVGIRTATGLWKPRAASVVTPSQFGHLPPAYVQVASNSLREIMYSLPGDYDPGMLAWEEMQPHVFTVGEVAPFKPNTTSEFAGPVMYLTGRNDPIVCDPAANITVSLPDCGVGKLSNPGMSSSRFPKAQPFGVYVPDRTGHNINLMYTAGESQGAVNQFLDEAGF